MHTYIHTQAIHSRFGEAANVPYGKVFSCFMASCLLGTTTFGSLQGPGGKNESIMFRMLSMATVAMVLAVFGVGQNSLAVIAAAFFIFEVSRNSLDENTIDFEFI